MTFLGSRSQQRVHARRSTLLAAGGWRREPVKYGIRAQGHRQCKGESWCLLACLFAAVSAATQISAVACVKLHRNILPRIVEGKAQSR